MEIYRRAAEVAGGQQNSAEGDRSSPLDTAHGQLDKTPAGQPGSLLLEEGRFPLEVRRDPGSLRGEDRLLPYPRADSSSSRLLSGSRMSWVTVGRTSRPKQSSSWSRAAEITLAGPRQHLGEQFPPVSLLPGMVEEHSQKLGDRQLSQPLEERVCLPRRRTFRHQGDKGGVQ